METDISSALPIGQPRVTAHEFVYDTLRRAILSGALSGGARLVQADIASQLSVSTTPVREALRDLAAEGLVVLRSHTGAVVRELDFEELVELYDIRKAVGPLAMRRAAARITPEELAAASALAMTMEHEHDPATWAALNRTFHVMLEDAARASFIQTVLKGVRDIAAIYVARSLILEPARIASGNEQHRAILSALARGDGDTAASILVQHLDSTLQPVLKAQSARAEAEAGEPAADGRRSNRRPSLRHRYSRAAERFRHHDDAAGRRSARRDLLTA